MRRIIKSKGGYLVAGMAWCATLDEAAELLFG